jgi:hypothetical protein
MMTAGESVNKARNITGNGEVIGNVAFVDNKGISGTVRIGAIQEDTIATSADIIDNADISHDNVTAGTNAMDADCIIIPITRIAIVAIAMVIF